MFTHSNSQLPALLVYVVNASLIPSNTHKLTKCTHTNTQVSAPDYFRAPTRSGALTGPGRPNCLYRTPGPHHPARSTRRSYCRRDAPTARCSSTPCSVRWTHFVVVCTAESMAFCTPCRFSCIQWPIFWLQSTCSQPNICPATKECGRLFSLQPQRRTVFIPRYYFGSL